ncbi:hypothetical protein ADUPG1_013996 [Aduncisulcus paluster]|uniref:Nudix hydrolase domain-containing protein n=1 Tax=Aduncisulcus paluster TaxID=2918883 RepID=A0ABQ5K571_9EUKA|nr:hypothetical protein ADUPG1_013996 [Aduncisulcus paluster]
MKLKSKIYSKRADKYVPGIVMLRGGAVAVLVVIEDKNDGTLYSVLTRQARVPIGAVDFPEIPAGMLDGSGNFKSVACKELEEEMGLVITADKLIDMTEMMYGDAFPGMYPSVGLCDEFIRLYFTKHSLSHEKIMELQGQVHGEEGTHEHIWLEVVPLKDIVKLTSDAKTLSAVILMQQLKL